MSQRRTVRQTRSPNPGVVPDESSSRCERCGKSPGICICDRIVVTPTRMKVLVLQHPREPREDLGTARLLEMSLPSCKVVVGLSWPSLSAALGEEASPRAWGVLFPGKHASSEPTDGTESLPGVSAVDSHGRPVRPQDLEGIVLLDGTWSQAKTLWWRNPWLLKLARLSLRPTEASMYGRLRREPRREWVSTLEAAADTLVWAGEDPSTRLSLRRVLRTLLQRYRSTFSPRVEQSEPKE